MTRRAVREQVFCALFQKDFYQAEEMDEQVNLFLNGIEMQAVAEENKQEIRQKVSHVMEVIGQLDAKIEEASEGWKASRMGKVELTIIRLALFEILYDESIPTGVAINEAVELAKKFGGDDSSAFVNGILAKLV